MKATMETRLRILAVVLSFLLIGWPSLPAQSSMIGLTVKAAVEEALKQNPGLQAQRSSVSAAEFGVRQARTAYYPRLDFEEIFTNGDDPVYVFGSLLRQEDFGPRNFDPATLNKPSPLNNINHRIAVSQLVYDGGRRERQVAMSQLGLESSREALRGAEQQILFNVIRDYYRVLLNDEAVRVAKESLQSAKADLEKARNRQAVGMAVKSDVMRLEVQVADFQRAVMSAESEARIARQELEVELGREPKGQIALSDRLVDRVLANPALDQLQIAASVQRPDIKLAALGADLARDKAKIAHASFWPTIGFQGSYDVNHGTSTGLGNQYLLAVRLQFNIFDAGAKSAALKRARAEQDAAEKGSQQVQQRVQLQVQSAYDRQRMAREQYLVAKQAVGWAEEGLRIMQNRHEAGLATVTDMLSAQNAWNQSRLSALQALFQYYVEFASMELAAGTLTTQSTIIAK